MSGIAHLKQPLQRHFPHLYSQANAEQRKNRIIVTSPIEQLFLGTGDYWNSYFGDNPTLKTVVGLFLSIATFGIAPIAIFIHQQCIEDTAQIDRDNELVQSTLDLLKQNEDAILDCIVSIGNKHLLQSFDVSDGQVNILVMRDGIFLQHRDEELMLMSAAQFLSNYKDRLKTLHLGALDLSEIELEEADLSEGKLRDANLFKANLFRANLSHADLCNTNLCEVDLRQAILDDAKLSNVRIIGTRFDGATFSNTDMTLELPAWNDETLAVYLNHLPIKLVDVVDEESWHIHKSQLQQRHKTGSILTAINSIDDEYVELKLRLIHQVINSLNGVDTSSVNASIKAALESNDMYMNDDFVRAFIEKISEPLAPVKKRHVVHW